MNKDEINKLFISLRWDQPYADQMAAIDSILRRDDIDYSIFLQPVYKDYEFSDKYVWENCAQIFLRAGYPRCKEYLDGIFEWIQDMNWPGAETIEKLLLSLPYDVFMHYYERAIDKAVAEDDTPWLFVLATYFEMRGLKKDDFSDSKYFLAINDYLPDATEIIRKVIEYRNRQEDISDKR